MLFDFPVLGFLGVEFRSIAKLPRAMLFRQIPNAALNEIAAEAQFFSVRTDAADSDVNVRMAGVVMRHSYPFELGLKVDLHVFDKIPRELLPVGLLAEFRGDDQLPQQRIVRCLPVLQLSGNIDALTFGVEPRVISLVRGCQRCAVACQILSMSAPLPARAIS